MSPKIDVKCPIELARKPAKDSFSSKKVMLKEGIGRFSRRRAKKISLGRHRDGHEIYARLAGDSSGLN